MSIPQTGVRDFIPHHLERFSELKARMLLQVHDELLFEAPEAEAGKPAAVAREVMEGAAHLEIPPVAGSGIGDSWA